MSPHAFIPRPAPDRKIFIRTKRPWWLRLVPVAIGLGVALSSSLMVLSTAWVIARMEATEAQLQAAHAAGMAVGMQTCPER